MKELISAEEMGKILDRLTYEIVERCDNLENLSLVGIHRRGVPLAKRIQGLLMKHHKVNALFGTIDITLYRDDLDEIATFPKVYATELPFDINGKTLILVDDVIYTGRTVRSALEAVLDFGRPARIMMVAMVDRGHRELPIQPDLVGRVIPTSRKEAIYVRVKELDGNDCVLIGERKQ